jgi:hypothetical protein
MSTVRDNEDKWQKHYDETSGHHYLYNFETGMQPPLHPLFILIYKYTVFLIICYTYVTYHGKGESKWTSPIISDEEQQYHRRTTHIDAARGGQYKEEDRYNNVDYFERDFEDRLCESLSLSLSRCFKMRSIYYV